ncbi:MAG: response regulator [Phycisphaerales bacterium]|nr:response regulator [Hyphomonadaceae bacterium]
MMSLSDLHLLVVDDNKQMRHVLRCLLRAGGIVKVTEAESAEQALGVMRASPIDLVLLDWKMAPIDGLSFARAVRWNSASPNPYIPILMLTAHTETSRVEAARDAGVSGFVKKPISTRLLFDRIAFALTDTRTFVRTEDFFGPDRRHGMFKRHSGPFRRTTDNDAAEPVDTLDLDDLRWSA